MPKSRARTSNGICGRFEHAGPIKERGIAA
jgi:hypothetical protein